MLFATDFLPERKHPEIAGYYKTYGDVGFGQMAPKVAEKSEDVLANTNYEEESFVCDEYRWGGNISEKAVKFLLAKDSKTAVSAGQGLVKDEIEYLANGVALREEYLIITAMFAGASSGNTVTAGNAWSDTTNGTPVADIRQAIYNIKANWHVEADTLLLNANMEMELLNHPDIKDILKYTSANAIAKNGISRTIPGGRILGLDVYVSTAVYTAFGDVEAGATETGLVGDSALVFLRGASLGNTMVAEPLEVRRWEEKKDRGIRVQVFKTMTSLIYRGKQIAKIDSV